MDSCLRHRGGDDDGIAAHYSRFEKGILTAYTSPKGDSPLA